MKNELLITSLALLVSCTGNNEVVKKKTPHHVQVEKVKTAAHGVIGKFPGRALKRGIGEYVIQAYLPANIAKSLTLGSSVSISLPLVNSSLQKGIINSLTDNQVMILLKNQIHDFADQDLEVHIPIRSSNLYEIPFTAVYSPIGGDVFVYTVESNLITKKPVNVIQVMNDSRILVFANGLDSQRKIVTRGLDNVVEGDEVLSEDLNEF